MLVTEIVFSWFRHSSVLSSTNSHGFRYVRSIRSSASLKQVVFLHFPAY